MHTILSYQPKHSLRIYLRSKIYDKKYYRALDKYERETIINCLNEKRNNLIADDKYTDAVDEVLLKILNAKQKNFKVIYKED